MALDPITAGLDLAKTVVQTLWPDKSQQEQQQLAAAVMMVQGQIDTNKAEAANPNVFVSGWRPFVGWVCGMGCAWNWIGLPIAKLVFALTGHPVNVSPADIGEMMPLLFGLLGMGGLRTIEKVNGVAAK
jgi:hypothetical protein